MKTRIIATIILAVLVTSCVTTPKTPEEIKAAGWVEVSAEPQQKWNGLDYTKTRLHPVPVTLGFDPLEVSHTKNDSMLKRGMLISKLVVEEHADVLHNIQYRRPDGKLVSVKERRWVMLPNRSREIRGFEQYTIGGKTYATDNIRPLMAEFSGGIRAPGIQVKIGSQMVDIPLNLLFKDMRAQYESLKKEYVIPKNKNENNPEYIRQTKLTGISMILGEIDMVNKLIADYDNIERIAQAAKIAEETAKRNRIAQEANLFSTYQDFADNARTNIAMLNNRSYWQQGIVYKLVFGGSDVTLNSEYVKAANQTMEGAYANALVQLAQGLLGEALVNQATGRRGTPSADSKYIVFMKHTITDWTSRTRFSSTVMTENGIYPLHIEASTMIDYIQKNHPDGFSYCRGYFVVEQLSPTLVLRPIQLGPIELWQVERDTGVGFDEIIKSAMSK